MPKKKHADPYSLVGKTARNGEKHSFIKKDQKPLSLNIRDAFYSHSQTNSESSSCVSSQAESNNKKLKRPKINSTTIDNEIGYKSLRALSSKKRKLVRESTVQQFCKPPRSKLISKKGFTSTRNNQSVVTMKKAKLLKKKGLRVLKNPEIVKLAPFSISLVTGKKTTCGYSTSATPNNRQSFGTPSCLKSIAERNKILKEIENLSKALLSQQGRFQMAVEKIKAERKKHKKTKKHLEKSELKKDQIEYLKRRIEDLKRNEENLLQDLVQQQSISKDALQGLENLRVKFDEEKKLMKDELDHYYNLLLEQEREKYLQLQERVRQLEKVERQVKEMEVKNSGQERRNNEQRETMYSLQSMLEDSRKKCQELEEKLDDKTTELELKETKYNTVISNLKEKLANLEEKTNQKYQDHIRELQEENQVKDEEIMMKTKEIEMLHANTTTKFSHLESRNDELEAQINHKERDYLEEKFRREELESEVKRLKEELDDIQTKNAMTGKYGFKDSYLANAQPQEVPNFKAEEPNYVYECKSQSNDMEYENIYGKLTSELTNLRNDINNLKSDKESLSSSKKAPVPSVAYETLNFQENKNYNAYYKKSFNNKPRQVLSTKKLNDDPQRNIQRIKSIDSNFSDLERLNALEKHLNDQNGLDEALRSETESQDISYRQSDIENFTSEIDPQYLLQSENQSPNQESYKNQQSAREINRVYWETTNEIDTNGDGSKQSKGIPNLNMDKVYSRYS
ncbi:unnamed protein product [Moneuplotes crassus]|uniref:Uncharacterized protein n=1 Tax=Euplotes crassus TaxID=5936 RepID=A0AAD2DA91_EUPCR|nr:unnamed protein product [Moneuplotes crassus]